MSLVSSYSLGRSYLQTSVPHSNPRQREIWEMQSAHQNRLNWLHFKARLDGWEAGVGEYKPKTEEELAQERDLLDLEIQLKKELAQERKLLEEARTNVQGEIDKCKKMLKEFRQQREKKAAEKRSENEVRRKLYEEELAKLQHAMAKDKADIRVAIHRVDYVSGSDSASVSALNDSAKLRSKKTSKSLK